MSGFVTDAFAPSHDVSPRKLPLLDRLQSGEEGPRARALAIESMKRVMMAGRGKRIALNRVTRFAGDLS